MLFIQQSSSAYEKQEAFIYLYPSGIWQESNNFFINNYLLQYIGEELHVPKTVIVFGFGKTRKVIR
jgi:hypothetical protein